MANMTMAEANAKIQAAGVQRNLLKTFELCARNGISLSHYARLDRKGKGCKFIDVEGIKLHTPEQEREWIEMLAAESEESAA
jgi:hypothetical protein